MLMAKAKVGTLLSKRMWSCTHFHHLSYALRVIDFLLHVLDGLLQSTTFGWCTVACPRISGSDLPHHSRVGCPQVLACVPPWLRRRPCSQPSEGACTCTT